MTNQIDTRGGSPFDAIMQVDAEGNEYWSARQLMAHFGYARWAHVRDGIGRAKAAIINTLGESAAQDHIDPGVHMVDLGSGATRQVDDFRLTRYGAYMWAMNGDPRKEEIAKAQTYFATKTREAEITPAPGGDDLDLLYGILDRIREDRSRIQAAEGRLDTTEARLEAIEGHHDWFTALGYAIKNGHQRDRAYLARVGATASRLMRTRGEKPVKRDDATFGEVNTYPTDVLAEAFRSVQP
ncbi:hypothetical protein ACOQFV_08840 [Nocardiopsis changdeensis]|uniref:Bro-N domain-containing protein n=1 Tax=Nocardiopsis changdeensis TaxID=2831969 RepID=A0ABX8BDW4_9ACTN|nr:MULTISPECIES: hypothetical protein [Nocardiopsis]QUX20351.1 hypothetical protein KGD84_17640 [Nocardiopsis changdeensis]QYX36281.1 hypothetical protein K1J57_27095 [Nocardiopsis sp. MT53]